MDHTGKIYLPYLHEWNHSNSDLLGLIQICIITFGEMPPVFAKSAQPQPPPPQPQQQPSYMAQTAAQPPYMPPYPATSTQSNVGYPPPSTANKFSVAPYRL